MANQSRYREVHFIGGRILQDRELNLLQSIEKGFDSTNEVQLSYGQSAIYRQGAFMNVTLQLAGSVMTITKTDNSKPPLIFIRDKWEPILNSEIAGITLPGSGTGNIYLNWELAKITSVEDVQLTDVSTGQPTAEMGELRLSFSLTDTSGTALSGTQLEKNLSPVIVATYVGSGSPTASIPDGVLVQAIAHTNGSGLVKLTGTVPNGVAAGDDDVRLSDQRTPLDNSVTNLKVTTPVTSGLTNADGTPEIVPQTSGVSAAKIVMQTARQSLEAGWNALKAAFTSLQTSFNAHKGAVLGLSNTHPMPTASDVSATPSSHVGQPLNLSTSHPAVVNQNSGGFRVNRDSSAPLANDPGYGIFKAGSLIGGILHDGDFLSLLAGALSISGSDGDGARTNSGSLDRVSMLSKVVAEHLNKVSHNNPHGLAAGDIGAATTGYVDTAITNVLAQAEAYTDTKVPQVSIRAEAVTSGFYMIVRLAPNNSNPIEIGFGSGTGSGSFQVPVPSGFATTNGIYHVSVAEVTHLADLHLNVSSTGTVSGTYRPDDTSRISSIPGVSWICVTWRQGV